jgi:GNAT superfamily N-acetyltransferase
MADLLTIRTTRHSDLSEIDALFQRSYPALLRDHYPPSLMVMAIPLISRANPVLVTSGRYFAVSDSQGRIVGAGGWSAMDPRRGRSGAPTTGHIRHVVTDHRRTREGIGRALMGHIFDDARSKGVMRLDCLSTRMAVPFYAACGFDEIGPVMIDLRPGIEFPAVLMQRAL